MPSFLDKAKNNQDEGREKDPAAPPSSPEPDWDNPDSWGSSGGPDSDSASGNAGDSANANDDQEHGPDDGRAPKSAKPKAPRHPPRRRGRPRGPEREMLSVRILASNNRKLTVAVEKTDLNPQTLVDQALEALFKRLKVEDPGAEQVEDIA
ncbi:hypothetical protein [Streptomyces nitrosporeus]|uniref:hypothetical protein n=1 Tax=Streptomyces nitrosporeus TaxID=28894 RepID=UPI00167F164D|nr:hypothetical protein [Streptomyces nitrosporeus]GGZ19756.1 hypothetical protein GCM10010327_58670 [Streptomyces nitrosporeus]